MVLRLVQNTRVNLLCRQHNTKRLTKEREGNSSPRVMLYTCEEHCQRRGYASTNAVVACVAFTVSQAMLECVSCAWVAPVVLVGGSTVPRVASWYPYGANRSRSQHFQLSPSNHAKIRSAISKLFFSMNIICPFPLIPIIGKSKKSVATPACLR